MSWPQLLSVFFMLSVVIAEDYSVMTFTPAPLICVGGVVAAWAWWMTVLHLRADVELIR